MRSPFAFFVLVLVEHEEEKRRVAMLCMSKREVDDVIWRALREWVVGVWSGRIGSCVGLFGSVDGRD